MKTLSQNMSDTTTSILELTRKEAQIIVQYVSCVTLAVNDDLVEKYPYANFYSLHRHLPEPGRIKIVGDRSRDERYIVALFIDTSSSSATSSSFNECLERVYRIKGAKSIAFPAAGLGIPDCERKIKEKAIGYPNIKTLIVHSDTDEDSPVDTNSEEFLEFVWNTVKNDDIFENLRTDTHFHRMVWRYLQIDKKVDHSSLVEKYKDTRTSPRPHSDESDRSGSDFEDDITESNGEVEEAGEMEWGSYTLKEYTKQFLEDGEWGEFFNQLYEDECIDEISNFLSKEIKKGNTIYPPLEDVYNAFLFCDLSAMKVVIIGQDPYHTEGAAMGLAFSHRTERGKIQPSLKNIYKELQSEGYEVNEETGDISSWAEQGVFLINTALTVRKGVANSHGDKLWGYFTNQLFRFINKECEHLVVIMWGKQASNYASLFDDSKHHKIMSTHPSPFSADKGFFGSKPFSNTNKVLKKWGYDPINWEVGDE